MEKEQLDLIGHVLSHEDASDHSLLTFEKLGGPAFVEIVGQLRAGLLSPKQQVLALRGLARLTRACPDRKEELLDLAMELLGSPDPVIRSGAINTTIWTAVILENTPSLVSRAENRPGAMPSLRDRVKVVVARAVELGVAQDELAREYLAH